MSHYHHKKRYSTESDDSSSYQTSHSEYDGCNNRDCKCNNCKACPPSDFREKYETETSERSCPDFSDLCHDQPRNCDKLKEEKEEKKKHHDSTDHDNYSDSDDSDYEDYYKHEGFGYCDKKDCDKKNCDKCNNGDGCRLIYKHDEDHSQTSVARSLGPNESSCPDLSFLARDVNKKKDSGKKDSGKKESNASTRGKKFLISYGPKKGHPWAEYNDDSQSVYINGKNGPVLHLYRDSTYFFCVEQCDAAHAFVLTNKPDGGAGSKIIAGGFEPLTKGCVSFKVDKNTPRYFFYQDALNSYEGGLVIVHDK